ncbi:MAG: ABC transporter permease [Planctomycetes bacterium]|nr:ABC transporter permease [Planctomycetota bacterium]
MGRAPVSSDRGGSAPGAPRRPRNIVVWGSALCLIAFISASVATLPFSSRWYNVQALGRAVRHRPAAAPVVDIAAYARASGATAATVPEPTAAPMTRLAHGASSWLGHDDLGRSLLFRLLPGYLVSLLVGLSAALIAVIVGTTWGAVAGLAGGRVDLAMMRIVDLLYGLPYVLMVIVLKVALSQPLTQLFAGRTRLAEIVVLFAAIGGMSWLTMARVVRGQVLSLRAQGFVEAARAAGAGPWHILRRHILPNLVGPIAVYATLVVPQAILQESFLSFLGIGIQQPTPSLGRLAADGVEAVNTFVGYWWLIVYPCAALALTLLALNFLGDRLRDALDPRSVA